MADKTTESLLKEIEQLRIQLHQQANQKGVENKELNTQCMLRISRELDDLIIKYMKQ